MRNLVVISTAALLALSACKSENPPLTGPLPAPVKLFEYKSVEQTAKGLEIKIDPRVDILFIIDDSASMRAHQENLAENMHKFVDAIAKVSSIDFHIGFTTVHDRNRYNGITVPERCTGGLQPDGRINYYIPGTLNPLLGPKTKSGGNYVTKDDDYRTILKETFDPRKNASLVKPLLPQIDSPKDTCPYGAEDEESFTPLLGAIDNPIVRDQINKGFRREGALFVGVIVSDATDAAFQRGELTIDQVVNRLRDGTSVGGSKKQNFRVYSVAMKPGSVQKGDKVTWTDSKSGKEYTCKADPAFASSSWKDSNGLTHYRWPSRRTLTDEDNPLALLAIKTRDKSIQLDPVLSICDDNYGDALARFGTQIQKDALRDIEIPLNQRPEATDPRKKMVVKLGKDELVENQDYLYDVVRLRLIIYGQKIAWDKYPGASISVVFTPVKDDASTTKPL